MAQAAAVPSKLADIGVIGLAVMGENLVLNFESRGYTVAVYNRTTKVVLIFWCKNLDLNTDNDKLRRGPR